MGVVECCEEGKDIISIIGNHCFAASYGLMPEDITGKWAHRDLNEPQYIVDRFLAAYKVHLHTYFNK
jgi:hypothetical protein